MAIGTLLLLGGFSVALGLVRRPIAKADFRIGAKHSSNNQINNNQNICLLKIAEFFEVEKRKRYLHTMLDLVAAIRSYSPFTVRSRTSQVKGKSLHKARMKLKELTKKECDNGYQVIGYLLDLAPTSKKAMGHAVFLGQDGTAEVDTAPKFRTGGVRYCYIVYRKRGAYKTSKAV